MRAAVLGSPIAHSLSPALHRAAYAELGLDWTYEAVDCRDDGLADLLDGLDDTWAGLSLTMPLKRTVVPLLDDATSRVDVTGVANTIVLRGGRRLGDNTDVPGLVAALGVSLHSLPTTATVLGSGATAASAVAALGELAVGECTLLARDPARARPAAEVGERVGVRVSVRPWVEALGALDAPLVISTAPAGATDHLADAVPGLLARASGRPATRVLLDVVYAPWPTPLAAAWARGGGAVVGGLELLVAQAALQVTAMTGRAAPLAVMHAAGLRALRASIKASGGRSSPRPDAPMG